MLGDPRPTALDAIDAMLPLIRQLREDGWEINFAFDQGIGTECFTMSGKLPPVTDGQ